MSSLDEKIRGLRNVSNEHLATKLLDPKNGILDTLQNGSVSHVFKTLPDIFKLISSACDIFLFPECSRQRLLKELITGTFLVNVLDQVIQESCSLWCEHDFLCSLFKVLYHTFVEVETLAYDRIYNYIFEIDKILKNRLSVCNEKELCDFQSLLKVVRDIKDRKIRESQSECPSPSPLPPNDFHQLTVYPTTEDFGEKSGDVFLRENKTRGHYANVEDYLDVQFRLMREDFIAPLRDGIQEVRNMRIDYQEEVVLLETLRMYPNTKMFHPIVTNDGTFYFVYFGFKGLKQYECYLKDGFFIMLSADKFQTVYCGALKNGSEKHKLEGYVTIKFYGQAPPVDQKRYIMLESNNFLDPNEHVLEQLKRLKPEYFPMKKYLIDCNHDVDPPIYLTETDVVFDLSPLVNNPDNISSPRLRVPYSDAMQWPAISDLDINENQYAAIKTALTNELSLIQGPPGTGKTIIGLKLIEIMLKTLSDHNENFPILVIAQTNHALDHFVEGISKFTKQIVRIGGQSKSEKIKPFTLGLLRSTKCRSQAFEPHLQRRTKALEIELTTCSEKLRGKRIAEATLPPCIQTLATLKDVINTEHFDIFNGNERFSKKDILGMWLLGSLDLDADSVAENTQNDTYTRIHEIERDIQEIPPIEDSLPSISLDVDEDDLINDERENYRKLFEKQKKELFDLSGASNLFICESKKYSDQQLRNKIAEKDQMNKSEADKITGLLLLPLDQRWRLYRFWISEYKSFLNREIEELETEHNRLLLEKAEMRYLQELEILRPCKIIAMTISGGSRYGRLLNTLKPRIVVIEEAAEVMESRLIASLSPACKHLILIGDHKQLKPNTSVYRLAEKYNLDVSLFERLVINNFDLSVLQRQYRMRPEISQLMSFIYNNLIDDEVVMNFTKVRGVRQNIVFLDHNHLEDYDDIKRTYFNIYEADFAVALCRHFLRNNYQPKEITLLTLYKGQQDLLYDKMSADIFLGVRICTVDNFQGEENNIVILSLVRSNDDDRIGFAGIENRICVALSRAKFGLYVLGNFELLKTKSDLWCNVVEFLGSKKALCKNVSLQCQNHPEEIIQVMNKDDFYKFAPEGGCRKDCNERLSCGHQCTLFCHPYDLNHEKTKCGKVCMKKCLNEHPCQKRCCSDSCAPCEEPLLKTIPTCGHNQQVPCHQIPETFQCNDACKKTLIQCGHPCPKNCSEICSSRCEVPIEKVMPFCGHEIKMPCGTNPWDFECTEQCNKMCGCGHECEGTCGQCSSGRLHISCKHRCKRPLFCGHLCNVGCPITCPPCEQDCLDVCPHNRCRKQCHEICTECREPCYWRCRHKQCTRLCHEECDRDWCNESCQKPFQCETCKKLDVCIGMCGERCPLKCRECDDECLEDFSTSEKDHNTRYITLWSCNHTFEVNAMDNFMKMPTGDVSFPVQPKSCPTCTKTITLASCMRYCSIIKSINKKILQIKRSNVDERNRQVPYSLSKPTIHMEEFLSRFEISMDLTFQKGNFKTKQYCCMGIENLQKIIEKLDSQIIEVKFTENAESHYKHIWISVKNLLCWLNPNERKFNQYEINQFKEEKERICDTVEFFIGSLSTEIQELFQEWTDGLNSLTATVTYTDNAVVNYPTSKQKEMKKMLDDLNRRSVNPLPSTFTRQESVDIVSAAGKGTWYTCPNNHVYFVDDDGHPKEQFPCSDCRVPIGSSGPNNSLAPYNRQCSEQMKNSVVTSSSGNN